MTHHVDSTRHMGQTEFLWHDLLSITAERDALREQVADLERRLADLTRLVAMAEVEDDA